MRPWTKRSWLMLGIVTASAFAGCSADESAPTDGATDGAVSEYDAGESDATTSDRDAGGDASAADGAPLDGATTDDGGALDAATDATNDAPNADADADASIPCSGEGSACNLPSGSKGLCKSGLCSTCTDFESPQCAAAYDGGPHFCYQGRCVAGTCTTSGQCSGGQACVDFNCKPCDARSGNTYVVDPALGNDTTAGSGMAGGTAAGECAWKTIKRAAQAIALAAGDAAPPVGTKIVLRGPVLASGTTGDTYPITLPQNVTLEGEGGGGAELPAGSIHGGLSILRIATTGVKLVNVIIDANVTPASPGVSPSYGINVESTGAAELENVEVRRATYGVYAQGVLVVNDGTRIHDTLQVGLMAMGTAAVAIASSSTSAPVEIYGSGQVGVNVGNGSALTIASTVGRIDVHDNQVNLAVVQNAKVAVTGVAANRSVLFRNGTSAGIQLTPVGANPQATVTGAVVEGNSNGIAAAGGNLKLRDSVVLKNKIGVVLSGAGDFSGFDLGLDTTTNAGGNVLQDPTAPNSGAGLCIMATADAGATVWARGNRFAVGDAGVDCKTTAASIGVPAATCAGGANVAGPGATGNTIHVESCKLE